MITMGAEKSAPNFLGYYLDVWRLNTDKLILDISRICGIMSIQTKECDY